MAFNGPLHIPKRGKVLALAERLTHYLFPNIFDPESSSKGSSVDNAWLREELKALLFFLTTGKPETRPGEAHIDRLEDTADLYFQSLEGVSARLLRDAAYILEFDPAAHSLEEVIATYPGFMAIMVYRIAHPLYTLNVPIIPRMISEWAHSRTGIDINPGATIGCPFFIDHGTGIVIGETAMIGDFVKLYQGVTLGAITVKKEDAKKKRHPTIENDVIIYAGSTILGGNTIIGENTIIGGNTWITQSVPRNSLVYHESKTIIRDRGDFNEAFNFVI